MLNHRIVPDGLIINSRHTGERYNEAFACGVQSVYDSAIPMPSEWTAEELIVLAGITKEQLDVIAICWYNVGNKTLSQIISELISLAISGLTVEEIRKLREGKP